MKTNGQTKIEQVDPLSVLYQGQSVQYMPMRKSDVDAMNYLVKISQGTGYLVETAKDWGVIAKLFEFWTRKWPHEWHEFAESIKMIRGTRARKDGKSKTREIKYVGALPVRFQSLIKAIFPKQQFDKKFVYKLTHNIKIVKVGEKTDTWFTIPNVVPKKSVSELVGKAINGNTK